MLDYVVGINCFHGVVAERQRIAQVCPHIAFACDSVGIHVDPARQVLLLTRAKMDAEALPRGSAKGPVKSGVDGHRRPATT